MLWTCQLLDLVPDCPSLHLFISAAVTRPTLLCRTPTTSALAQLTTLCATHPRAWRTTVTGACRVTVGRMARTNSVWVERQVCPYSVLLGPHGAVKCMQAVMKLHTASSRSYQGCRGTLVQCSVLLPAPASTSMSGTSVADVYTYDCAGAPCATQPTWRSLPPWWPSTVMTRRPTCAGLLSRLA